MVITQKLQKYVVKWYHTYILCPELDQTEAMVFQHLCWPGIVEAVQREVMGVTRTNVQNRQEKKR